MRLTHARVHPYHPVDCPHRLDWTQVVKVRGRTVFECRGCGAAERAPFWYTHGRQVLLAVLLVVFAFRCAPVAGEAFGAWQYARDKQSGAMKIELVPAPSATDRVATDSTVVDRLVVPEAPAVDPAIDPVPWSYVPPKRA